MDYLLQCGFLHLACCESGPRQPLPGTRRHRCRCSLPGLTGLTTGRRGVTNADRRRLSLQRVPDTTVFRNDLRKQACLAPGILLRSTESIPGLVGSGSCFALPSPSLDSSARAPASLYRVRPWTRRLGLLLRSTESVPGLVRKAIHCYSLGCPTPSARRYQ